MFQSKAQSLVLLVTALCFTVCTSQPTRARPIGCPACPGCPPPRQCPSCPGCPPPCPPCPGCPPPPPICPPQPQPMQQHICNCNFNTGKHCEKESDKCKWELVFKAVKGNGRNVYNDFTDDMPINENNAEAMIISSNKFPFKSPLINDWNKMFIKQVKVDVFNKGERKAWFLFDGSASTRTDWFTQDRLIASPYDNLKTDSFTFFSAEGKASENLRFYINENDGPCSDDCGYLAVVDMGADKCPWARIEPKPYFLYNPTIDQCCVWNDATDCSDLVADIMFVVDVSGSISNTEFAQMVDFLISIVDQLPVASDKTRIGAISFSGSAMLEFKLNDFSDQAGVLTGISAISNSGGTTNTAEALNLLKSTAFLTANGNRVGVPDVVIVLTDGGSTDPSATLDAVMNIATENYQIFTIGIGSSVNDQELDVIASKPEYSLRADFDSLNTILDALIGAACRAASPVRSAAVDPPPPSEDKLADVFAVSIKTCELDW